MSVNKAEVPGDALDSGYMEQYYLHDLKQQRDPYSPCRLESARSDEVRITEEEEEPIGPATLKRNKTRSMANL